MLKFLKWMTIGILVIFAISCGIIGGFLVSSKVEMNKETSVNIGEVKQNATTHIYDVHGNELASLHGDENRVPVKLSQVPQNLKNAVIATEDVRFYQHHGVDWLGIARAAFIDIFHGRVEEGASTITQQLAKNYYLTNDRNLARKLMEWELAIQLETRYSKDEILEMYLNQIYFGKGAYGVQVAAWTYFGKPVEQLDLNECAVLAGLPQSPNYYCPFDDMKAAQARKAVVIQQMQKYGYVDPKTAAKTISMPITLAQRKPNHQQNMKFPYYVDYVVYYLVEKLGADQVYKGGLKVYTSIDPDMQAKAEITLKGIPIFSTDEKGIQEPQGALVAVEPQTGFIKAMAGGRGTDYFNRSWQSKRQPGSSFKAFVFAAALENGMTPATIIDDSPIDIDGWQPQNFGYGFRGQVPLRYVVAQSLNVSTVKIAQQVGLDKIIKLSEDLGITTIVKEGNPNDNSLALVLGGMTDGATALDMAGAYGGFANNGKFMAPTPIIQVQDMKGELLIDNAGIAKYIGHYPEFAEEIKFPDESIFMDQLPGVQVIKTETASALTEMLQGAVQHGTGTAVAMISNAAGKTGTSSDYRDAWFVGYTPQLAVSVWVGNDNNQPLPGITGGQLPAILWRTFFQSIGIK